MELAILALKTGVLALPAIVAEWGLFVALFAFFAFMPLGHFTIGVLLVLTGAMAKFPDDDKKHELKLGYSNVNVEWKGSTRIALIGIGVVIVVASFGEFVLHAASTPSR